MKNKKKIIIIIITIVALVIVIGLTYAVWSKNYVQPDKNTMVANCFDISYKEEKEITMTSMYPQRDEEGLTNEAYKVTIENTCEMPISYKVKLRLIESSLNKEYIKVGVGTNIVTLSEVPKEGELYLIREDILAWKGKRIIDIRSWMEENTPIEEGQNKSYRYKIEIEGTSYNGTKRYLAKEITAKNKVQEEVPAFNHSSPEEFCDDYDSVTKTCNSSWTVMRYGDGLFAAEDDDGTSYYFRGEVYNNNVKFANLDWKILRINGDGSIRLIAIKSITSTIAYNSAYDKDAIDDEKYVGYTYDNSRACTQDNPCISNYKNEKFMNNYQATNSSIKIYLEEDWYKNNLASDDEQIALASYCNDTSISGISYNGSTIYYGADRRTYTAGGNPRPILTCPNPTELNSSETHNYGGVYKLKVGLITADELNVSGFKNVIFYDGYQPNQNQFLAKLSGIYTISPSQVGFDSWASVLSRSGDHTRITNTGVTNNKNSTYPVINLKSDVTFTTTGEGEPGSSTNPYIIQ